MVRGYRGILGSNWNNSVNCSSRSSNWNNSPLNLNSNNSSRGVTDTEQCASCRKLNSPLADSCTLSSEAKYTTTASYGLVNNMNVSNWDI